MKSTSKSKAIHYKSVFISGEPNIQALLDLALSASGKIAKPSQRQQKINDDDSAVIFINKFKKHNGMSFGQLVILESGKKQTFITVDDEAEFYSISSLSSEKIPEIDDEKQDSTKLEKEASAKKRREFIESILYFGVLDNHMIIMQSSALKSRELEAHLSWLLGTCSSAVPPNSMLILRDKPAESVYKKMEIKPVKSIQIGAPLTTEVYTDPSTPKKEATYAPNQEETHANKVRFVPHGMAASLIRAALPSGFLEKLDLEDSLDEANIHVALEITYLRKTSKAGQKIIDSVATSLRHSPESDVVINLQGGGKIRGDELKLSGNISVKFLENGLIDESILFHEMHTWLISKISTTEIDPTAESAE
ncbi:hypothetical protein [Pseudomonas syringae]|uniref:hypothetical protein n=1 Tax=Pseudomonas syringae TaxID=317 RepID=UPI001BCCABCF|nr:hypothetical protein [Pseudomonas syringae]QVI77387.1 hypothetical protein KHW13_10060 [Pseudomonas syringae]